jgi:hypothetical protein
MMACEYSRRRDWRIEKGLLIWRNTVLSIDIGLAIMKRILVVRRIVRNVYCIDSCS